MYIGSINKDWTCLASIHKLIVVVFCITRKWSFVHSIRCAVQCPLLLQWLVVAFIPSLSSDGVKPLNR